MQLKANIVLHGALKTTSVPQGQPIALLWEMGDVIPGLASFLESYLPSLFSQCTPRGISAAVSVLRIEAFVLAWH